MEHRKHPVCADVQSTFLGKHGSDRYQVLPKWSEHVAGCATCRRALMLVAQDVIAQRQDIVLRVPCEMCQRDLAAYVDLKQAIGNRSAAERYPHVWWHLWTCAECAETYEWLLALVEAEANGELEAFPFAGRLAIPIKAAFKIVTVLTCPVPRFALTFALGPSLQLGAIRGSEDEMTLIDDDVDGYQLTVAVSHVQGVTCNLRISTQPPVVGWALFDLGAHRFKAMLDEHGTGQVSTFPMDLLQAATGPDLLITIQTELHEPST